MAAGSLPAELLLAILSSPDLSLIDLARCSLAHPSLSRVASAAASQNRQARLLEQVIGFVPQDVLSSVGWERAGAQAWKVERVWEVFSEHTQADLTIEDIVSLVDIFSRLACAIFRAHRGFPDSQCGALPYATLTSPRTDSQTQAQRSPPPVSAFPGGVWAEASSGTALVFLHALIYAGVRGASRRGGSRFSEREAEFDVSVDADRREKEWWRQYKTLRKALRRTDPLGAHLWRQGGCEGNEEERCACACRNQSWASWWLGAHHHLTMRYRRFFTPADILHLSYRVIYYAVPSFPPDLHASSSATSPPPVLLPHSQGPPPLQSFLRGTAAYVPRFSAASPTSVLLSTPLNPDSVLFSLREGPTFSQTKRWFNLSEHALPAGLARLWAGWIGFGWGDGGVNSPAPTQPNGKRWWWGEETPPPTADAFAPAAPETMDVPHPVDLILLAHARWRARTLRAYPHLSSAQRARATAFDTHFVRRALQIQGWALAGPAGVAAAVAFVNTGNVAAVDASRGSAGSVNVGSHGTAGSTLRRGWVSPGSPFLTLKEAVEMAPGLGRLDRLLETVGGLLTFSWLWGRSAGERARMCAAAHVVREPLQSMGWGRGLVYGGARGDKTGNLVGDEVDEDDELSMLERELGDLHQGIDDESLASIPFPAELSDATSPPRLPLCLERPPPPEEEESKAAATLSSESSFSFPLNAGNARSRPSAAAPVPSSAHVASMRSMAERSGDFGASTDRLFMTLVHFAAICLVVAIVMALKRGGVGFDISWFAGEEEPVGN